MSNEITMPKLSDTMEEGKILRWLKHPGDTVHHGDALAEVETDKADMVMESFDDGVLEEIRLKEGESARVGAVIATLRRDGEEKSKETGAAQPQGTMTAAQDSGVSATAMDSAASDEPAPAHDSVAAQSTGRVTTLRPARRRRGGDTPVPDS
jgi:pyruvate dehydrogenase E2 component (dihydrolipoamide acetyltransferase)